MTGSDLVSGFERRRFEHLHPMSLEALNREDPTSGWKGLLPLRHFYCIFLLFFFLSCFFFFLAPFGLLLSPIGGDFSRPVTSHLSTSLKLYAWLPRVSRGMSVCGGG